MADLKDLMVMSEDDVSVGTHRDFYKFWQTFADAGRLPARADLDPAHWRRVLAQIMLVDVERFGPAGESAAPGSADSDLRFRFRLMGDHHVEVVGRNMTGEYLHEALELDADAIITRYASVAHQRRPHLWRNNYLSFQRRTLGYERVAFPFANDGQTVDLIVSLLTPTFLDGAH